MRLLFFVFKPDTMQLLDGKATARSIKDEIAEEVEMMKKGGLRVPHLVAVLVGHDGGSEGSDLARTAGGN